MFLSEVMLNEGLNDIHLVADYEDSLAVAKVSDANIANWFSGEFDGFVRINGILNRAEKRIAIDPSLIEGFKENLSSNKDYQRASYAINFYSKEKKALLRFRITHAISFGGMRKNIFIRSLPNKILSVEASGAQRFLQIVGETPMRSGLVLVAGQTGSGKSTFLASVLQFYMNSYCNHILTVEDPIEYLLTNKVGYATQKEIGKDIDSFSTGLRAAVRETPNIIMIGEVRDKDTALAAMSAVETGHMVFSTVHSDRVGIARRMLGLMGDNTVSCLRLAQSLTMTVHLERNGNNFKYSFTPMNNGLRTIVRDGDLHYWQREEKVDYLEIKAKTD